MQRLCQNPFRIMNEFLSKVIRSRARISMTERLDANLTFCLEIQPFTYSNHACLSRGIIT